METVGNDSTCDATMEHVTAKQMLKVTSVILVLMVSTTESSSEYQYME